MTDERPDDRPALRIVRGHPTPEDLAVITALVAAAETTTAAPPERRPGRGQWTDPRMMVRKQLHPGPGAWRAVVWG